MVSFHPQLYGPGSPPPRAGTWNGARWMWIGCSTLRARIFHSSTAPTSGSAPTRPGSNGSPFTVQSVIPFIVAPGEPELPLHGGLRLRQRSEVRQLRGDAALLVTLARHDEAHDPGCAARAELVDQRHLRAYREVGEVDDHVKALRLGDLDPVVLDRGRQH